MSAGLQIFAIMMAVFLPMAMVAFVGEYFKYKTSTRDQLQKLRAEMESNNQDDLEKSVAEMKQRIEVLEQIVTDRSYNLERKIGNL